MTNKKEYKEKSYQLHSDLFKQYTVGSKKENIAKSWFINDTVDSWRHNRMYKVLDPLLVQDKNARWLTVGDGRYGKDAKYILEKGIKAIPSDISEHLLKEAKNKGYINEYFVENAESLSFSDSTFDYIFCKESYHHFPRPMLALYEMLRVAKKGVVLIEPNDHYINDKIIKIVFRYIKSIIKLLVRGEKITYHEFEEVGNYLYSLSKREIEKFALGLNYKIIAFKGINDAYFEGVEKEKLSDKGPLQKKVKFLITMADILCRFGFMNYGMLAVYIFKEEPSKALLQNLKKAGCEIIYLPNNPYIDIA